MIAVHTQFRTCKLVFLSLSAFYLCYSFFSFLVQLFSRATSAVGSNWWFGDLSCLFSLSDPQYDLHGLHWNDGRFWWRHRVMNFEKLVWADGEEDCWIQDWKPQRNWVANTLKRRKVARESVQRSIPSGSFRGRGAGRKVKWNRSDRNLWDRVKGTNQGRIFEIRSSESCLYSISHVRRFHTNWPFDTVDRSQKIDLVERSSWSIRALSLSVIIKEAFWKLGVAMLSHRSSPYRWNGLADSFVHLSLRTGKSQSSNRSETSFVFVNRQKERASWNSGSWQPCIPRINFNIAIFKTRYTTS